MLVRRTYADVSPIHPILVRHIRFDNCLWCCDGYWRYLSLSLCGGKTLSVAFAGSFTGAMALVFWKKNSIPDLGMPLQSFAFCSMLFPIYADFFNIDLSRV
jgi:hypothetical protein